MFVGPTETWGRQAGAKTVVFDRLDRSFVMGGGNQGLTAGDKLELPGEEVDRRQAVWSRLVFEEQDRFAVVVQVGQCFRGCIAGTVFMAIANKAGEVLEAKGAGGEEQDCDQGDLQRTGVGEGVDGGEGFDGKRDIEIESESAIFAGLAGGEGEELEGNPDRGSGQEQAGSRQRSAGAVSLRMRTARAATGSCRWRRRER